MARTMYDGSPTGLSKLVSQDLEMVMGGPAWSQTDFNRWPWAVHVRLDHTGGNWGSCQVLDYERMFAFGPVPLLRFVKGRLSLGPYRLTRPTIYLWHGNYPAVADVLDAAKLTEWDWIAADQTGIEHDFAVPAGWKKPVGTQWSGGNQNLPYDITRVIDDTWCPDMRMSG